MFENLNKGTKSNGITEELLDLIKKKQLSPGERLPAERELARMMNVGRPSLREALQTLAHMNVVEIKPGSGTYITALQPEKLVEHLEFVFELDETSIFHLFETRKTLELQTAFLAAEKITVEELEHLAIFMAEMQDLSFDHHEQREIADREFHKLIATASRNPLLQRFVSIVNRLGTRSRRLSYNIPGSIERTLGEHQAILSALKNHDPQAAQAAMLNHLNEAEQSLRQLKPELFDSANEEIQSAL